MNPPTTLPLKRPLAQPLDLTHGRVDMSHGAGGRAMAQLIEQVFKPALHNPFLAQGDDGARLPPASGPLVLTTDAHVVFPLFFPGGDIGSLAVNGTINDVAVMGAQPLYLTASFVLEEGFALADLVRIVQSMGQAARAAGVPMVTGDTKVVERGKADGVFISTTGLGVVMEGVQVSGAQAQAGDAVLVSGPLGLHGMAIMSARNALGLDVPVASDTAALHGLIATLLQAVPHTHVLRDPTRGGLAATLNEIAHQSGVGIELDETALPIPAPVQAACELLGLDPLDLPNEGNVLVICPADVANAALAALRSHPLGAHATRIGRVTADPHRFVQMRTRLGGHRMVDWLAAEALPRIC